MKIKQLFLGLIVTVTVSSYAHAGLVTVWGEALSEFSLSTVNSFYDGLADHSSSIATGTLDTVDLSNSNLLWATQPADNYTGAELNAMSNYLLGGGRIAFLGEHGGFGANQNNRINTALDFLGSTISINNTILDASFRSASVADGQILDHDLTAGVDFYEYAAFAPLTISGTAEALMLGEEDYLGNPSIMMAFQNIGPGSIFLITDQNVWDNSPDWGDFDNARMFENLVEGETGAPPVDPVDPPTPSIPEPGTLLLLGLGLAGFGFSQRKIKS